jgi:hypothetical protein
MEVTYSHKLTSPMHIYRWNSMTTRSSCATSTHTGVFTNTSVCHLESNQHRYLSGNHGQYACRGVIRNHLSGQYCCSELQLRWSKVPLTCLFNRINKYGFHVHLGKWSFFQPSIKLLGFTVDKDGCHPDPQKVAVAIMPTPHNIITLLIPWAGQLLPVIRP